MCEPVSPPDYEEAVRRASRLNARRVGPALERSDNWIYEKVRDFAETFGFEESEVVSRMRSDPMLAAKFAKKPNRQRIHLSEAAPWISERDLVDDFRALKLFGNDALYVGRNGCITDRAARGRAPRALSFMWTTGETEFYALHDFTKESGGSQNARFREIRQVMRYFQRGGESAEVALVVITDGEYYTSEKIQELRALVRESPPLSYVCPIEELPAILERHDSL